MNMDGIPGFGDILKTAQHIKGEMARIQEELKERTVEAAAGGGMVKATANGHRQLVRLEIEPEVVNPEDITLLEDLIVAATNQALKKAQDMAQAELQDAAGSMGLGGLAGMGPLGPLANLFG